jgi:ABC-type amino acid transport substrate-binding protein
MRWIYRGIRNLTVWIVCALMILFLASDTTVAGDLAEIKQRGVLRHLGVPYANFVTGSGDGLDVELIRLFAEHLGVKYRYVKTDWDHAFSDLIGKDIAVSGADVRILGNADIRGDILANGVTILKWRKGIVDFSTPTFPTQIWLLTRADSTVNPIKPSPDLNLDIQAVRQLFENRNIIEVMGKPKTCVDPRLYDLKATGVRVKLVDLNLAELVPAMIAGESTSTLIDVPDALIALQKWTGQVKIIGPISEVQMMACAFAKEFPELRDAFNTFFKKCKADGTYRKLVENYYPKVFYYFPVFFQ